jgi:hypothetical protein
MELKKESYITLKMTPGKRDEIFLLLPVSERVVCETPFTSVIAWEPARASLLGGRRGLATQPVRSSIFTLPVGLRAVARTPDSRLEHYSRRFNGRHQPLAKRSGASRLHGGVGRGLVLTNSTAL